LRRPRDSDIIERVEGGAGGVVERAKHLMKHGTLLLAVFTGAVFSGCAATATRKPARATASTSDLPPHAVEVDYGLISCERGYVFQKRRCIPEEEISQETQVEIYDPNPPPPVVDQEAPPRQPGVPTAMPSFAWNESDFPPRPVTAYRFSRDPRGLSTVIGDPTPYTLPKGRTLYEAARHLGLGINQVAESFAHLDLVAPPAEETLDFPTWWILPESDDRGIVVNIPELRLYYFPPDRPGTVITYPVGLGDDGWRTPVAQFKVVEKTVDPTWLIPESIRKEHIRERGDSRTMIPGGDPDNPLGHYRLRLSLPLYGIHGTNIPWGIGMEVTHGCIRLYPEDIQQLFSMIPVGMPGQFVYQPVKVGTRNGNVYIEVHPDVYETGFNYLQEALRLLGEKGWSNTVDWNRLTDALEEKRGVPTRISDGASRLPPGRRAPVEAEGTKLREAHSAS
jgi:L,D-transpeptidase ErfK/SrfK